MDKFAGLEETEVADPKNGKDIAVSTTVRIVFRELYPEKMSKMRNDKLNIIIANDFASSSGNVLHYFWINKEKRIVGEIRQAKNSMYYISAIRGDRVDILTLQGKWFQPKYVSTTQPIEVGEEE